MRFLALLGFVLFQACAPLAPDTTPPTYVEVRNGYKYDAVVRIATDAGDGQRVDRVLANSGRVRFRIPRRFVGRRVRFQIDTRGEPIHYSEWIVIPQGRLAVLEIAITRGGSFLSLY